MHLFALGWDDGFAAAFQPFSAAGLVPARVALQHKHAYELLTPRGVLAAECTGRLLHHVAGAGGLPAVGDWVAAQLRPGEARADIHAVLPRRTKFARRAPGRAGVEQVVAANIDTVLLVTALDQDFNLRRIERYLTVAWESGAQPVVVLNKADLHPDPAAARAEVSAIARGAPVVVLSALGAETAALSASGSGPGAAPEPAAAPAPGPGAGSEPNSVIRITEFGAEAGVGAEVDAGSEAGAGAGSGVAGALGPWLAAGRTLALLGSSGVGKSTLINRLLGGERQRTCAIGDAVGKGRHTTTWRELIVTPGGALVIDTPGMRELQFAEVDPGALDATFADIGALAACCRFHDCSHRAEPGCAVQAALEDGTLDAGRWQSFLKLQREQAYAARKADPRLARQSQAEWKKIHRAHRARGRMEAQGD